MSNDDTRPRLYDLWSILHFRSDVLAEKAGISEDVILRMFRYEEVKRDTAEKVLAALSSITGQKYTLKKCKNKFISGGNA
jgi:hypothetical protein